MKMIDDVIIIGIDSGYGNIKTANCCFPASVSAYDQGAGVQGESACL